MIESWRWFGPQDAVTLADVRQTGATGIVTALHDIPNGVIWTVEQIRERQEMIRAAGLEWVVVESIPVHEDIKTGAPGWQTYADNWAQTFENLAECGIKTICYNFMPVLDWTRTDLYHELENGARCLRYDAVDLAMFDIHILKRPGADADHLPEICEAAKARFAVVDVAEHERLMRTIIAGLPGSEESYTLETFAKRLETYNGIGPDELRGNLAGFLRHVLPRAEAAGVVLAIHPDDPPRSMFGLPRVVSTAADMDALVAANPSPSNGFTFCTGSYGVRADNDLPAMIRAHRARIYFVHLRATKREADGVSFHEADHLDGDVDMVAVVRELLAMEKATGLTVPFRPDHGHAMRDDMARKTAPGYPLIGRLRGLAEIRGIAKALSA
ncbi:mannonate dehydratase [Roseibium litorale]|uniref:Mannonate dehydratase n=1 Tax=Roseibium litorale TaxID=2803841 RepID=A0ABR9CJZ2_9HYPH|nr:mannonate dehydratase [Roseibium litorale]MBD8890651.1 mannonate dehydratase [Roseibium litorale]